MLAQRCNIHDACRVATIAMAGRLRWLVSLASIATATRAGVEVDANGATRHEYSFLDDVRAWMEAARPRPAELPPPLMASLAAAAWSTNDAVCLSALGLLRQLDDDKLARRTPELLTALAIALARAGALDDAATAFERAAAVPPGSVLRFTSHRRHNLELISGAVPRPQHDVDHGIECAVDVRANLSEAEFAQRYVLGGRPVLLPLSEVAKADRDFWDAPSEGLARTAGDCIVPVVSTSGVVDHQYGSSRGQRLTASQALRDYFVSSGLTNCTDGGPWACSEAGCPAASLDCAQLAALGLCEHEFGEVWESAPPAGLQRQQILSRCPRACSRPECADAPIGHDAEPGAHGRAADPPYVVFTRTSRPAGSAAQVRAYKQCWALIDGHMTLTGKGRLRAAFLDEASHKRILFAGPAGSGPAFHDHSNAFNLLPYGRKRWLLLPPSGTHQLRASGGAPPSSQVLGGGGEGHSSLTPLEWLARYEADPTALPIAPLRCTQPSGTALFVPSGWKHAIINEEASVGVAVEVGDLDVMARAERGAG